MLVIGQDIRKIRSHVDVISPMLYPSHFSENFSGIGDPANEPYLLVNMGVKMLREIVGQDVVIRPWLQAFPLKVDNFGPDYIQAQIQGAVDGGARGWLLWSPGNYYRDSYYAMDHFMFAAARQTGRDEDISDSAVTEKASVSAEVDKDATLAVGQCDEKQLTDDSAAAPAL